MGVEVARGSGTYGELGYAEITSNFSTGSTTNQFVTGLEITITVTNPNKPVLVEAFTANIENNTADGGGIMSITNADGTTVYSQARCVSAIANGSVPATARARLSLAAGSHTFRVYFARWLAGTTATLKGQPTYPAYIRAYQ